MSFKNPLTMGRHPLIGAFGLGMFLAAFAVMLSSLDSSSSLVGASRWMVAFCSVTGIVLYATGVRSKSQPEVRAQ